MGEAWASEVMLTGHTVCGVQIQPGQGGATGGAIEEADDDGESQAPPFTLSDAQDSICFLAA